MPQEVKTRPTSNRSWKLVGNLCCGCQPASSPFQLDLVLSVLFRRVSAWRLLSFLYDDVIKWKRGWWSETPSRPLWRHCNDTFEGRASVDETHKIHYLIKILFITRPIITRYRIQQSNAKGRTSIRIWTLKRPIHSLIFGGKPCYTGIVLYLSIGQYVKDTCTSWRVQRSSEDPLQA